MNYTALVTDTRFLTRTDSTEYTAAQVTQNLNNWYHRAVTIILDSQDDWDFDDPNHGNQNYIKTYNLTASTQLVDIDVLTNKILKIKRVEVTYDGTTWYKANPMDIGEYSKSVSTTTNISSDFSKTQPYYDLVGENIYLYPIPDANVTNGLKIWFVREVDEFTTGDSAQEPGIDEPFHKYLSLGAALDYAVAYNLENKNNLSELLADYEQRMRAYYGRKDMDRQVILKSSFTDYN